MVSSRPNHIKSSVPHLFLIFLQSYHALSTPNNNLRRRRLEETSQCHHSAKYHTHMHQEFTCINDNIYPAPWDNPPMSERFFFTTAEECCDFYFPDKQCQSINVCGEDNVVSTTPMEQPEPSKSPTVRPTTSPTKPSTGSGEIPTVHANDGCHKDGKWHADTAIDGSGCTNNDVYPSVWDEFPLSDTMFFDDAVACCDHFFEGQKCGHVDVCGDKVANAPTLSPTSNDDGSSPTGDYNPPYSYPPNNPCNGRKWHPDTNMIIATCTNNLEYPPSWNNGVMDGVTMFDDPDACCTKLMSITGDAECILEEDSVCKVDSETASPTAKPSVDGDCLGNAWHPDEAFTGCTNTGQGSYPIEWDEPNMASKYLFLTSGACCSAFFQNRECVKTDVCPVVPKDCSVHKWHPTTDFKKCSNNLDYPPGWAVPPGSDHYMHDTYDECCASVFSGKACPKDDVCAPIMPCEEQKWHPTTDFKKCSNNLDFPPGWAVPPGSDHYMHDTYDECCAAVFSGKTCPKDDVCAPVTPCEEQKWHPTTSFKTCTNSLEYPSGWTTDNYLHSTFEKCCLSVFGQHSCPKEDVCPVKEVPCYQQMWHPTTDFKKCTNSLDFPSSWSQPPMNENYMHHSYDDCCSAIFSDGDCPKEDVCPPISCEEQMWHPTTDFKMCTNNLEYPSGWAVPPESDHYMHSSYSDCCAAVFPGQFCPKQDVCQPEAPCEEQKWHPTTDFKTCTNSIDFPVSWLEPPMSDQYLHDNYDECCAAVFFGRECPKNDVCNSTDITSSQPATSDLSSTSSPTSRPITNIPTYSPTKPVPTSSPIECQPAKWHPGEDGSCSNSPIYNTLWDLPALSKTYLHETHASCCQQFYDTRNCGKEDVCDNSVTLNPTASPTAIPTSFPTNNPSSAFCSNPVLLCSCSFQWTADLKFSL